MVFKVCSCILDQTNQKATRCAERVSMGARLTQQCLPVSARHCAVCGEGKKIEEEVKMRGAVPGAAWRNHRANAVRTLLQGSLSLCCIRAASVCCVWRERGKLAV